MFLLQLASNRSSRKERKNRNKISGVLGRLRIPAGDLKLQMKMTMMIIDAYTSLLKLRNYGAEVRAAYLRRLWLMRKA